jgi:glycerate kinase
MRVVVAPDKFKSCLPADQVCAAIAQGLREADAHVEIDPCPLADGGEGIVQALVTATDGELITKRVTGPLPDMKVDATFGLLGSAHIPHFAEDEDSANHHGLMPYPHHDAPITAVIEMSAASGLALLAPEDRDPMHTTTFGTGELLMEALKLGARRIILGIGGSATNDAGIGAAQACGLPVILEDGEPVSPTEPLTGADVSRVVLVKHGRGSAISGVEILVACDVDNPLYGPRGAARIFGAQKGAIPQQIDELDLAMKQLAQRLDAEQLANTPCAGAAGGLGFGMMAFFNAHIVPGVNLVIEATNLRKRLAGADLCITGEGSLDATSLGGKAAIGVARLCKSLGIPCVALVGSIQGSLEQTYEQGLTSAFSICPGPTEPADSIRNARFFLSAAAANLFRTFAAAKRLKIPPGGAFFAQSNIADDDED